MVVTADHKCTGDGAVVVLAENEETAEEEFAGGFEAGEEAGDEVGCLEGQTEVFGVLCRQYRFEVAGSGRMEDYEGQAMKVDNSERNVGNVRR